MFLWCVLVFFKKNYFSLIVIKAFLDQFQVKKNVEKVTAFKFSQYLIVMFFLKFSRHIDVFRTYFDCPNMDKGQDLHKIGKSKKCYDHN